MHVIKKKKRGGILRHRRKEKESNKNQISKDSMLIKRNGNGLMYLLKSRQLKRGINESYGTEINL